MKKGTKHTEETKKKLSEAHKGKQAWNKGLKGFRDGHIVSEETRKKISQSRKGIQFTEEHIKNLSESHKGNITWNKGKKGLYKASEKTRKKQSKIRKKNKKNHPNWKGGISPINNIIRKGIDYRLWREAVFARDNFTCQKCGTIGGKLAAHHIKNFAQYPELRFAIDNGITFCKECHMEFHNKYGRKNNTSKQLKEFLLKSIK